MLLILFTNLLITGLVVVVHYEALTLLSSRLPEIDVPDRLRVLIGLVGSLLAHVVEVWLFAFAYYALIKFERFGSIEVFGTVRDNFNPTFLDCIYFSLVNYTSLGYGDLVPVGPLQFLAGLEALVGLVLIAWTASFMFFQMQRNW